MHPRGRRRGTAPTVRHKLHIVSGCGKPRRLLIPLFLTSVKSHAAARRRKLRIVRGCGEPRRLLTPLLLLSVKSHASVRLFACKRAHNGSLLLPTFYGGNALTTAHACYQLFTVSDGQLSGEQNMYNVLLRSVGLNIAQIWINRTG